MTMPDIKTAVGNALRRIKSWLPDPAERALDAEATAIKEVRANRKTWPLVLLLVAVTPGSYVLGHRMAGHGIDGLKAQIATVAGARDRALKDAADFAAEAKRATTAEASVRKELADALTKLRELTPDKSPAVAAKPRGRKKH